MDTGAEMQQLDFYFNINFMVLVEWKTTNREFAVTFKRTTKVHFLGVLYQLNKLSVRPVVRR